MVLLTSILINSNNSCTPPANERIVLVEGSTSTHLCGSGGCQAGDTLSAQTGSSAQSRQGGQPLAGARRAAAAAAEPRQAAHRLAARGGRQPADDSQALG